MKAVLVLLVWTAAEECGLLDPVRLYIGSPANFEDGSNCQPFASLASALAALPVSGGTLILQPLPVPYPANELTIHSNVTIEGSGNSLEIASSFVVTSTGQLLLTNTALYLTSTGGFQIQGRAVLLRVAVSVDGGTFVQLVGDWELVDSRLTARSGNLVEMLAFGANVTFRNSTLEGFSTGISFKPAANSLNPNSISSILLQNCTFSRFARGVEISADFAGVQEGLSQLNISNSRFSDFSATAVSGNFSSWSLFIANSRYERGISGVNVALNDQQHSIQLVSFSDLAQGVVVSYLGHSISIEMCSFERSLQGVRVDSGAQTAWIAIISSQFDRIGGVSVTGAAISAQKIGRLTVSGSKIINSSAKTGTGVYCDSVVLVDVSDCQFFNLSSSLRTVFDIVNCDFRVKNSSLLQITAGESIATVRGYAYSNYTAITARNLRSEKYIFHSVSSTTFLRDSLIEDCGSAGSFLLPGSSLSNYVQNSVFRNVTFESAFLGNLGGVTVYFQNVIIQAKAGSNILSTNSGPLVSFQNCRITGQMAVLLGGEGPPVKTVVSNCVFENLKVASVFAARSTTLEVYNSTFRNIEISEAQLSPLSTNSLLLSNVSASGIAGQFLHSMQCSMVISLLTVWNCSVPQSSSFISAVQSSLDVSRSAFTNVSLGQGSVLLRMGLQSTSLFASTEFRDIDANSSLALILIEQSDITLKEVSVSFVSTSIVSALSSAISVLSSQFSDIGQVEFPHFDGGVLNGLQSLSVFVSNCTFTRVKSRNGGALYITYSNPNKATLLRVLKPEGYVEIHNSTFTSCQSSGDGAGLYLAQAAASLIDLKFRENAAGGNGGAVAFYCRPNDYQFACFYYVNRTEFVNNSAQSGGGAIKYDKIQPLLTNISSFGNSAVYGDFLASYPVELREISHSKSTLLAGESGIQRLNPISVGLYDALGQLVLSDSLTKGVLRTLNRSTHVSGLTTIRAYKGVYRFGGLTFTDSPGTVISLQISSEGIDYVSPDSNTGLLSLPLDQQVALRSCGLGEIVQSSTCQICAIGTFSFNTSDTVCKSCPKGLTCYGGANTTVEKDYWRVSNTSERLLACPVRDICVGGNTADCASGHEGRLCTSCKPRYFRFGSFLCLECGSKAWGIGKGVLVLLGTGVFFSILIICSVRNSNSKKSALIIHLRIFLNYTQVTVLMSSLQVKWPDALLSFFEGLKFTGNATQFAFSNECITGDYDMRYAYQKVVAVAVIPMLLLFLVLLVWGAVGLIRKKRDYLRVHFMCSAVVLLLSMQPIVLQVSLQMYSCVEVEIGTSWLLHDMEVACWQGAHLTFAFGVALPAMLIWSVGTPLLLWGLLFKQRQSLRLPDNLRRIGFLYAGYRPSFYFWEFLVVLRKSLMAIVANTGVSAASTTQMQLAILVLWTFLLAHSKASPFDTVRFNRTEFLSLFASLVTVVAGSLYLSKLKEQTAAYYSLLVLVFVANAAFLCTWLAFFLFYLFRDSFISKWLLRRAKSGLIAN